MVALFLGVQLADAVMTASGAVRFGAGIEANPILQGAARIVGLGTTLIVAKTCSVVFAAVLHVHARYLTLTLLILTYIVVALLPWAWLLAA